ncbi:MAG: hypothetical protein H7Z74_10155, partial [Anaerolineae bacterium]|nr:hypothetical protein [Gemmatimonadaceae bacterium]
VTNTDALIIDLRENGGGNAQTAALLASYFSAKQSFSEARKGPVALARSWLLLNQELVRSRNFPGQVN